MTPRTAQCHYRIAKFFAHLKSTFIYWFNGVDGWIDAHVVPILHFVEGIKAFIDNPLLQTTLEALVPQLTPEKFAAVDAVFDKVIEGLQIEITCKDAPTLLAKVQCVATALSALHPELKDALLAKIASWLTRLTAGDVQFMTAEVDTIVQFAYAEMKHATNPATGDAKQI